ncbi:sulfur oxidation c-type cytochrome SoxA [Massilia sp. W12]|uniref:sulfur oxidation c-type cytochrome SoxA n=1 Tax=Massilia sp. W12 TaxID=3126507 RepID=UPI0030CBD413
MQIHILSCAALLFLAGQAQAQNDLTQYRELLAEGNPAELWEMRGAEIWQKKDGPKQASLQACDLGKGAGVTAGAYVELPRYFADTGKVMDLEQRLLHCRITLQGWSAAQARAQHFGAPGKPSVMEALAAWIAGQSRGMKMAVSTAHPQEQKTYKIGEYLFHYRAGSHDFSCASCHSSDGQRIRMQDLPNILRTPQAQAAYTSWPAYRVSQGEVRSMQHRLSDCLRQQRFAQVEYGSDTITALTMFLAKNANGGVFAAPALKR